MKFDVLTIFPEIFDIISKSSIIGKAVERDIIEINTVNIRDFSANKHKKTDDYPYGGGSGMVMTAQPVYDAYKSIVEASGSEESSGKATAGGAGALGDEAASGEGRPKVIYLSPQGNVLTQKKAYELAGEKHLILLCGHYEWIDERIIELIIDEEISIGDYVLTGGELPAMVLIDCVSRLIPGVLGDDESSKDESHADGLLEYPQYTRPVKYLGLSVPEILLSGHHANIEKWRREKSLERTKQKRPDLLEDR